jgi:hypothetical protein
MAWKVCLVWVPEPGDPPVVDNTLPPVPPEVDNGLPPGVDTAPPTSPGGGGEYVDTAPPTSTTLPPEVDSH